MMRQTQKTPGTDPSLALKSSPRAKAGLWLLGGLTLVWISTLPRPALFQTDELVQLEGHRAQDAHRHSILDLQLGALERDVSAFEPGRNIFTFASQPTKRATNVNPDRQGVVVKTVEKKQQSAPAPDPTPDANFLGIFGPDNLRLAVLKDKDGETVSNYRVRDIIDDRFRILSIDLESILLKDLRTPGSSPIRLKLP